MLSPVIPISDSDSNRTRTRLVESLYTAIVDPCAWQSFLMELVKATNSRSARMLVMNPEADRVTASIKVNIDDAYHDRYVQHYLNCCPWRPELSRMRPGRLYSTYLHFSCRQRDFYRTEFFNEWAAPQDIHHGMCGTVLSSSRQTVQLLIQRTRDQGHYSEQETAFVNELVPHIQHSLHLARKVGSKEARSRAVAVASSQESLPFLLLDKDLKIVHCSPGAQEILKKEPLIRIRNSRLTIELSLQNQLLKKNLQQCLASPGTAFFKNSQNLLIIPRENRHDLHLLIRPIHPDTAVLAGESDVYAAVYIHDFERRINLNSQRLKLFFSLSDAETRVAKAIVSSPDTEEAAAACSISLNTLRSHLKSIFGKTGSRNRAELIKHLLSGPAKMN